MIHRTDVSDGLLSQVLSNSLRARPNFLHGGFQLVWTNTEFFGPVTQFIVFVNVDAVAVLLTAILPVVWHGSLLSEIYRATDVPNGIRRLGLTAGMTHGSSDAWDDDS
jgi:hypothetical protein